MRSRLPWIILCIGALIVAGCGQPDGEALNNAQAVGSPEPASTLVPTTAATVPVGIVPTVDIGVEVTADEMIAAAIEFSTWREVIAGGEPEPLLALPGIPNTFNSLGLNIGNWDPTCVRPMYLVILKGDFDGANLFFSPGSDGEEDGGPFGQYLGYVFDLNDGVPGSVAFSILSDDGAIFKQALGDPSLPDEEFDLPKVEPPYVPCENVYWEGAPEPEPPTS